MMKPNCHLTCKPEPFSATARDLTEPGGGGSLSSSWSRTCQGPCRRSCPGSSKAAMGTKGPSLPSTPSSHMVFVETWKGPMRLFETMPASRVCVNDMLKPNLTWSRWAGWASEGGHGAPGGQDSPTRTRAWLKVKWRSRREDGGGGRKRSGARAGRALRCVRMALNKHAGAFSESQEFPKYNL